MTGRLSYSVVTEVAMGHDVVVPSAPSLTTTDVVAALRAAGCVFAEDEARLLIDAAASPDELRSMVDDRVAGLPLEQILGWAEFCGLRVLVAPHVFVPRRRSELLVRDLLAYATDRPIVVDLCCGTGAVGLAIAIGSPGAEVHAVDIDAAAVRCADSNLRGVGGTAYEGDLFAALPPGLRGRIDVVVANAPYVPTDAIALMPPEARLYEPRVALDGGIDGLSIQRRIAAGAREWLTEQGRLLIETSGAQADATMAAFAAGGFDPRTITDADLDATAVVGALRPPR